MADTNTQVLREALKPFADFAEGMDALDDEYPVTPGSLLARRQVTAGDFKRAREAFYSTEGT